MMSILKPFPLSSMLAVPFCDYLNVTTPLGNGPSLLETLVPLFESLGPIETAPDGVYRLFTATSAGLMPRGVFKCKPRGKVFIVSASGGALDALRSAGLYSEYLSTLAAYPHRVSMLHATQDYHCVSTSAAVLGVKDAAYSGELSLTRKRILPEHVRCFLQLNAEGSETGTIYLGNRANADVWAKVYDKREERLSRGGVDPGPVVRIEIAVQSGAGATLRDAFDPASLFFHFASRTLVEVSPSVPPWSPHGEGYVLAPKIERTIIERIDRVLSFSPDIQKLVGLAREAYGAKAGDVLAREFQKLCASPVGVS